MTMPFKQRDDLNADMGEIDHPDVSHMVQNVRLIPNGRIQIVCLNPPHQANFLIILLAIMMLKNYSTCH